MLYEVIKYNSVDDEIEKTIFYYEFVSYEPGLKFESEIERPLNKPETDAVYYFNPEDKKHRRTLIEGFPYAFIYSIEGRKVIVKILFPQKEDPAKLWVRPGSI